MGMDDFFIDPSELPEGFGGFVQLIFLFLIYGYILCNASNLISDGSELLLLVPWLAEVVGSCVLPVLGAVPDGAIVLFSGLGENAQEELEVGVGALVGSTIMLLTIPWAISIYGGRVSLDEEGKPLYRRPNGRRESWSKLEEKHAWSLTQSGVAVGPPVRSGALIMMLTALAYLIIEIPALVWEKDSEDRIARGEHWYALLGMLFCFVSFIGYLWYQFRMAGQDVVTSDKINEVAKVKIAKGEVSLLGVVAPELMAACLASSRASVADLDESTTSTTSSRGGRGIQEPLLSIQLQNMTVENVPPHIKKRIAAVIQPFFTKYDVDKSGFIDLTELQCAFSDLGEYPSSDELGQLYRRYDINNDGIIDFEEFTLMAVDLTVQRYDEVTAPVRIRRVSSEKYEERRASRLTSLDVAERGGSEAKGDKGGGEDDDDDDEEEELPEDLKDLSWSEQQYRIKVRSALMMAAGTVLVLVFSDPMVSVLSAIGRRLHVPAFYVSFVLAPLASNASELIASYNYACKKTSKTIAISLSTLTGAGTMNATFTLGLFLLIIYSKGLAWTYSAEILSILLVEAAVALYTLKRVHTLLDALLILSLYPLSLMLVWGLTSYTSWN